MGPSRSMTRCSYVQLSSTHGVFFLGGPPSLITCFPDAVPIAIASSLRPWFEKAIAMSFWSLVLGLLAALACAVRTGSTGTSCCVNQGTNFEAKDLMKMCEFLLSDPHEKSDAERLKNANKCMSRMHLSEMGLPDMKISKQSEDCEMFRATI
ncbi:unnamed protein product [Cladocopium goreaui]|uniref:Uncharacterized protein n=1 Tax=Cladocopium goreaui TaxID=2562237 RepID=A0A9P1DH70_9DINO|nr:unnamed protein product [Cladocopium goreaui]